MLEIEGMHLITGILSQEGDRAQAETGGGADAVRTRIRREEAAGGSDET
jgi:hypothetical protein